MVAKWRKVSKKSLLMPFMDHACKLVATNLRDDTVFLRKISSWLSMDEKRFLLSHLNLILPRLILICDREDIQAVADLVGKDVSEICVVVLHDIAFSLL